MADTHVVSALRDRYARLKGEARKLESDLATIQESMAHVKATIRLFNAEVDDALPIRPKLPSRWTKRNGAARYAMQVLKEATEPMTARDIALRSLELAELPIPNSEGLWHVASGVNTVLKRYVGNGVMLIDEKPKRWQVQASLIGSYPAQASG